jgi:putative DNA primase/helicase
MAENLLDVFLGERADDEGNAQCVWAATEGRFLHVDAWGWLTWTGSHWTSEGAEPALDRAVVATLKQRWSAAIDHGKDAIWKASVPDVRRVNGAKQLFRSMVSASIATFDAAPDALNVANGVLNLRTGVLAAHNPAQRFTYVVPVEYDPTADCAPWEAFLRDALHTDDATLLTYLQTAVGYSLTGHTSEESLWYVYGPARSGKGTFTESLLALLPAPLGVEVDFATFTAKREGDTQNFDLAPLKPARLIVASESNRYAQLNTAKLKALTGGNYVRAAYKHRDHFSYRPQFKAWLVSNEPLNADVDDDAAWYRAKVLHFPNGHAGSEDKSLKQRMKSPDNLRGVLRWAVEGAMRWYAAPNGLEHPKAVEAATQEHRDALDFVGAWLEENCVDTIGGWSAYDALYPNYRSWCMENGVTPKELRSFTRALKAKGYPVNEVRRSGGKLRKGVLNVGLLSA